MDLLRAGETPELLALGRPAALLLSPHGERFMFQGSDSEDATRDPDPVLPSMGSGEAPLYAPFSV